MRRDVGSSHASERCSCEILEVCLERVSAGGLAHTDEQDASLIRRHETIGGGLDGGQRVRPRRGQEHDNIGDGGGLGHHAKGVEALLAHGDGVFQGDGICATKPTTDASGLRRRRTAHGAAAKPAPVGALGEAFGGSEGPIQPQGSLLARLHHRHPVSGGDGKGRTEAPQRAQLVVHGRPADSVRNVHDNADVPLRSTRHTICDGAPRARVRPHTRER